MEISQNNISTIVSMIVPFISYLIAQIFGFNIDQAMLAMFLTGIGEIIFVIWSAINPNTMEIFGNGKSIDPVPDVLNDEYVAEDAEDE